MFKERYGLTTATEKLQQLQTRQARIRAVPGGTAAGKTLGILGCLIDQAQRDKQSTLTSVVSESFPHLRRGAIRDFMFILESTQRFDPSRWHKTEFTYTFETGSKIEFFSADQPDKVRGPRRQRLFINEANNVPFETYEQLEVRTEEVIWLDWNPTNEFWYYTDLKGKRGDIEELTLTYLDNEALPQSIVDTIESRKHRAGWWKVYGLGQLGEVEGQIYTGWEIIEDIPKGARLERYGLNFGFTGHPASLVAIYYFNQSYIIDQVLYGPGIKNRVIADTLNNLEKALVVADSAEPKSIDELMEYGVGVMGCAKGKDSVQYGIGKIKEQNIKVTKKSVDVIKEYRNYLWEMDRNGKILYGTPAQPYHYSMDAVRYGMESLGVVKPVKDYWEREWEKDFAQKPKFRKER